MTQRAGIGLDVGGTKTAAVLVTEQSEIVATASESGANYQASGNAEATRVFSSVATTLFAAARERNLNVEVASLGVAGLDRPRDEEVLRGLVDDAGLGEVTRDLVNDAYLVLRAGTRDGVGVAVISGTGSNCVGVDANRRPDRIGGLCWELGDEGGAGDLGVSAMRAAMRGADGRGEPTTLTQILRERLDLDRMDDIVDRFISDTSEPLDPGALAPMVFEAAADGDDVAKAILQRSGADLGLSASILLKRMFQPGERVPLVMGGAVLQHGACDDMRDAVTATVSKAWPSIEPRLLDAPPVLGAALLALDKLGVEADLQRLRAGF